MKRILSKSLPLLLSLLLLLPSLPLSALAEGEGESGGDASVAVTAVTLDQTTLTIPSSGTGTLTASITPDNATEQTISWSSSNTGIATVASGAGKTATVTAVAPGTATITATAGKFSATCSVTVSGLVLSDSSLRLVLGNSTTIGKTAYGDAKDETKWEWTSSREDIASIDSNGHVTGLSEGTATITCQSPDGAYLKTCTVNVVRNEANTVRTSLSNGILELDDVESDLNSKCYDLVGASLSYVTNLSVPTEQGILYVGYVSAADPGAGVATSQKYYCGGSNSWQLSDVVFVPKPGYSGNAAIHYTGIANNGQSYVGEILVTVDAVEGITYTSETGEAIQFQAEDFSAYSQSRNGRAIKYVTFSLPASRYGTLYYNYTGSNIYESNVESGTQYNRSGSPSINNVFFVPAEGYTGSFYLSYEGCDTAGKTFRDSIRITVSKASGSSGSLSYNTRPGQRVYFKVSDFSDASYDATGYQLNYVRFSPPSSSRGVLYYNGSTKVTSGTNYYRTGSGRLLEDVSFVADDDYTGTVNISFTGYDTHGDSFGGTVKITVSDSGGGSSLSYTARSGQRMYFDVSDFSDASYDATGYQLNYVKFSLPSSSRGVLYYDGSTKVSSSTAYYRTGSGSTRLLEDVSFIPDEDYSGTFSISFTGYNTQGKSFSGSVRITVSGSSKDSPLSYTGHPGQRMYFDVTDFSDASYDETGYQLNYVKFTLPSSSRGVLYYNGSTKVSSSNAYYRTGSTRPLEDVSFVPDKNYTGTFSISFTGYNTQGKSFTGSIRITVTDNGGSGGLSYTGYSGQRMYFDVSDFSDASYDETGYQLDYVKFSLPSSSRGVLYYNGSTKVSSGTAYYRTGSTRPLEDVSFIPDEDYSGTFSISFTGYNTQGKSFTGSIRITVTDNGGSGALSYTGYSGQRLFFDITDFSDACYDETGYQLNYVKFTLPSSSTGVLYYDGDTKVSSGTSYYRTGSNRLLEDVSFVPDKNYTGTARISFTGYDLRGNSFSRTIKVTVTKTKPVSISYTTAGPAVTFQSTDFAAACSGSLSSSLSFVRIVPPDASVGTLYASYTSPTVHTAFSGSQAYYVSSSPALSQVAFVPKAGYSGTVHLSFTATDTRGNTCTDTIKIQVTPANNSSYFSDMGNYSWAAPSVDFLHKYQIVSGTSSKAYSPAQSLRRGDFILMLSRAFQFADAGTYSFRDVPQNSYYAASIASAKAVGVAAGDTSGNFRPTGAISRQDAAVILYRSMRLKNAVTPGGASDLARFSDAGKVSPYAAEAMGALVRLGVFTGDNAGRLNPGASLTRAEMAVILHRALA